MTLDISPLKMIILVVRRVVRWCKGISRSRGKSVVLSYDHNYLSSVFYLFPNALNRTYGNWKLWCRHFFYPFFQFSINTFFAAAYHIWLYAYYCISLLISSCHLVLVTIAHFRCHQWCFLLFKKWKWKNKHSYRTLTYSWKK